MMMGAPFGGFMRGPHHFEEADAEAEIERLERPAQTVSWNSPIGQRFDLDLLPTVYGPREDTNLLAQVINKAHLSSQTKALEIGCGAGAVSLFAASLGWSVTSCDINPYAVACTKGHAEKYGYAIRVREGGPGPLQDGLPKQWMGDERYDVVMWNMPYLSPPKPGEPVLGPLEEAAMIDTDDVGLYARFLNLLESGQLLRPGGRAYVIVSNLGIGDRAMPLAWRKGFAARVVGQCQFEEGEVLSALALWRPFPKATVEHHPTLESTNAYLLNSTYGLGSRVSADHQSKGRGRRGRSWTSPKQAVMASWVVALDGGMSHSTMHQLLVGHHVQLLLRTYAAEQSEFICLKWPNDLFLRSSEGWQKFGGILFEARSSGKKHRIVLGLGLNLVASKPYGSLLDVLPSVNQLQLMEHLHAMVASLFDPTVNACLGEHRFYLDDLNREVRQAESNLGPLFYRNEKVAYSGMDEEGQLLVTVRENNLLVDDPDALVWSSI